MFWGVGPALDLQEEYRKINQINSEFSVLLIGSCDARHVLKTISQAYRHKTTKIRIDVIEGCLELIGRQLMLISIALEDPRLLGLLEKTRLFMEIYGNALIRPSASKYTISKARCLVKMITDLKYMSKMLPNVSIEGLKYRERDYLEMVLKFWQTGNTNQFDVCDLWDRRLRKYLGVRYDCKNGVFDWDYNMRLRDLGGATVSSHEYKHFRGTGVAFTWLESEVSRPNCTLAAGVIVNGDKFIHHGYIGDIITGPYIAYGLDCEDKEMLTTSNRVHLKRATDISERNIMRMLYEIQNQQPFHSNQTDNLNLGAVTLVPPKADLSQEIESRNQFLDLNLPSIGLDHANISFHSPTALQNYPKRDLFDKRFDLMYVSSNMFKLLTPDTLNMIKDNGIVIVETKKFILDMKKDSIKAFVDDIKKFADINKCEIVGDIQPLIDSYVTLKIKRIN